MSKTQSVDKTLTQARKAEKDGDWATAHGCYQSVLDRFPANSRAQKGLDALRPVALPELLKLAKAAQSERKWTEAEKHLRVAVALAPEMLSTSFALAGCQLELRDAPAALITAEHILEREPENPEGLNYKGRALRLLARSEAAQACFQLALGHPATDAQTLNNLGILARAQGDRAAATDYYRRAIAAAPTQTVLHKNLSEEITYSTKEPHLDEMLALLASIDQNDPDSAPLYFALFKAMDDLGDTAKAFAYLKKGNQLVGAELGYDFQKDAIPTVLSKLLLKGPLGDMEPSDGLRPIFVTGLPRSGTTLTERILARSQDVQPCGELSVVNTAVFELLSGVMHRENKALTPADIADLGHTLRAALAEYSDGSPFLVDKMPLNFRWIGFLCAALPEARIVHVSRNPIAVAWSLYRQRFAADGNGFVYDPENIARFMVLHREMMTHWEASFPGRIFDLSYEALVTNPEPTTRALAKAAGLEWSSDWLTPEQATNQVLTASAGQVRRPIYHDSNEDWKRYETQLAPMLKALSDVSLMAP